MPVCITAKKACFRRCGVDHPSTRTEYPDGTFTADEVKELQREPMLVVELIPSGKTLTAAETIALVLAATTLDALDALAAGETRKTVLDAIGKRRGDLQQPAAPETPPASGEPAAPPATPAAATEPAEPVASAKA
jgi:hypothetical protein